MKKELLTNCRLVLPDAVAENSSLLIEDGFISAIEPDGTEKTAISDLRGAILMPGMIDLHCDALEKEIEPRPNVLFPLDFAMAQADRRNAQAGITTVFHALSFAHGELGVRNRNMAAEIARQAHTYGQVMVDNRIHGRYEITDEESLPILCDLIEEGTLGLISMMDHTPGQGQFKDLAAYRNYLAQTYAKSVDEAEALIRKKFDSAQGACERIKMLAQKALESGIRVASHDDDSPERVQTMSALGGTVSEFPVNHKTAQTACDSGLWTVFGAPNILRGSSQSGSMKALEAVQHGVARCLCSDYHPGALLAAVFRLPRLAGIELANAVRLVTANPALAAGLEDRGKIEVGKRADLAAVNLRKGLPYVMHLWVQGNLTYCERHSNGE